MSRPLAVDLFAGAGGLSLGFEQAGFDVVAAVELDPIHCAVHKYNFPTCAVLPRSVMGLSGREILDAADIRDRSIDCVFGGPPCQGFSLIGHRVLDDPRNRLVLEFVRIVKELDARTFVFENVKGLTIGRHRSFLRELTDAFQSAGYVVNLPWSVLDAADHGVPQKRERLILLGAKEGVGLPEYPSALSEQNGNRPSRVTCSDALSDLPDADEFAGLESNDAVRILKWGVPSVYASEMRCLSNDAWHHGYMREWNPAFLTSSWRTEHSSISRRRFAETSPGAVEPISRFFRLQADGLSNTLRAGTDGARGAFTSPRPIHYRHARCVTVREMARLHGFPDWFRFHATKWHGARQVGNAVPPPLARTIGRSVLKALKVEATTPRTALPLGGEDLLYMDMSEAAEHFGVPAPQSKRDRKSGARKRKQQEIEAERLANLGGSGGQGYAKAESLSNGDRKHLQEILQEGADPF